MTRPTLDLNTVDFALVDTPEAFEPFADLDQLVDAIHAWRRGRRLRIQPNLVVIGEDDHQVRPACSVQLIGPDDSVLEARVALARDAAGVSLRADALMAAVAATPRKRRVA